MKANANKKKRHKELAEKTARIYDEQLRKEMRLTQIKIQTLTGIDQGNYSKLERGMRNMSINECEQLAILFETSMDYLVGLTDERFPYVRSERYKKKYPMD